MKWFVNQNSRVHGPYDNSEIQGLIQTMGTGTKTTFLWTRGLNDWITADKWTPSVAQSTQSERLFNSAAVNSSRDQEEAATLSHFNPPRPTKPAPMNSDLRYKVQYNFIDQGMMTKDELLKFSLNQDDVSKIAVFDNDSKQWKEIYAITEISEKLGISRRKNARVPILAQFSGASSKNEKIAARVVTISVGGMGLTDTFDLNIGDSIRGQITSPHFFTPLNIEAEVTYTGSDGYVGLKFNQLNDDTLALMTEYVKKFSDKS
jgi:hypothetical protein